jgi:tetratricopeptide (TPR) repeat protein
MMNVSEAIQSAYENYQAGNLYQAENICKEILKLQPDSFAAYNCLGNIYKSKGQFDRALAYYHKAIELRPDSPEFYYNAAVIFQNQNRLDEAVKYYLRAVEINPTFAEAHLNISLILLLSGNYEEGWKAYEWRWHLKEFNQLLPLTSKPFWNGTDISGLTIFLYSEQGLGDTIQFIRYVPLVAQRGAKVIVECQKELSSLIKNTEGVDRVISQGEQLPEFDVHCPLLRLPLIFHTTLESIPARIPYISVDSLLLEKWSRKIKPDGSRIKIGLVWAGSRTNIVGLYRSCSLDLFSPLAQYNDITFYSLQKGEGSAEALNPPAGMRLIDYTEDIQDFSDTAAIISNLDLVISIDTAVAHLAGALGKPVWTLLPFSPDWRWMLNRQDSPWYPTMRLFRQPSAGNWMSVINIISNELKKTLEEKQ